MSCRRCGHGSGHFEDCVEPNHEHRQDVVNHRCVTHGHLLTECVCGQEVCPDCNRYDKFKDGVA